MPYTPSPPPCKPKSEVLGGSPISKKPVTSVTPVTHVTEVADKIRIFRSQLRSWTGSGIPLLTLPGAPEPQAGHCISCGVTIEQGWRCRPCLLAVYSALDVDIPEELLL